nr:hypothetical protein [Tanacetum cinerariifolium]
MIMPSKDNLYNGRKGIGFENSSYFEKAKDLRPTLYDEKKKYAKLEAERYEYMIRYSAYFDNDKQHRTQIANQRVLYDKMSVQLVELDKHVRDLKNTMLEKDFKISESEECVQNKDLEIEKCLERLNVCENKLHKMGQTNQTVHMIMPSKDNLYNGRKEIGFENPSYFEKAKDLRPTLYDEKIIGLGCTLMFLTHSDEALEIKKFKRSRENKTEFAYDYGNLNASYVNEKINLEDDYFQEIINPDFDKIDSPFQQTSSLKPYVSNVILEKIIIYLEDKVVSLLEKEKENLETIESLKSKGFESSEIVSSESENQSENDCHVVEKQCGNMESSKVITPGMFKLNVSQSKEKVVVSSDSEGSEVDDFKFVKTDTKKVKKKDDEKKRDTSRVKCYNCKKEGHFSKDCKKAKVKDYEYYKTKMLLTKKDKDEQVLLAEDQAWMESSSDSDQEINANMVFMAQIEKVVSDSEASSSSADEKIYKVSYYLSESERSEVDDFSELKKITALLAKAFNRRKFYSKTTNNNLRTSSSSQSANKKQEFIKSDDKKVEKKADEKKRDMSRVK